MSTASVIGGFAAVGFILVVETFTGGVLDASSAAFAIFSSFIYSLPAARIVIARDSFVYIPNPYRKHCRNAQRLDRGRRRGALRGIARFCAVNCGDTASRVFARPDHLG